MEVKQFWRKSKAVAEVPSHGEKRVALLNLEQGSPLVILGTAVDIWDLLDGTRTETEIFKELNSVFSPADRTAMEEQVRSFLAELARNGLAGTNSTAGRPQRDTETGIP
ncbi:PqqD family protein [Paenarthrobacter sp. NPDC056912]|uniref:PqqD family protein n=1 Tax=Paenarthrobacter sp. NPDC056912 TaxID=3345965 RepID=UPI00366AE867